MDHVRFDALARSLTASQSRRGMLRVVAAAALGTLFSARTARDAAAACREAGQRCSDANGCCPGSRCIRKFCRCKLTQGFQACNGAGTRCVNTNTSEQHCGNCDAPCPQHHVCQGGSCIDHCQDGERDGDETARDCGGDRCPKCGVGKACRDNDDCQSAQCVDRVCVQCTTDAHCEPLAPLAGVCVNNVCRQCRDDAHCNGDVCIANNCEDCRTDADCPIDKPVCDKFHVCRTPATCPAGSDLCAQGFNTPLCGSGCRCHTTTEGETRCLGALESSCNAQSACTSRAQCEARHGAGAFCVKDTGSFCGCRHCAVQCFA